MQDFEFVIVGGGNQTTQQVGKAFDSTQGIVSAPFTVNPDHTISQTVETTDPNQGGEARYLVQDDCRRLRGEC